MTTAVRLERKTVVVPAPPVGAPGPAGPAGTLAISGIAWTTPQQHGAVADGVTDDSAAFVAALAALKAAATTGYGYGRLGGAKLFVPKGVYFLGTTTLDVDFSLIIEGESVGYFGSGSTVLKWTSGTTGIRTQGPNTTGATGVKTPVSNAGYATFRNLLLDGGYTGGAESEAHGVHLRWTSWLDNVAIYNFPGDGLYQNCTSGAGAPTEGASNNSFGMRVLVQGCRNGFFFDGADVNAGNYHHCSALANRMWGFWDSSFLGNFFHGCHTASNGYDGAATSTPTACTYLGNRYYIKPGQAAGASTNAPSGTTSDNMWWGYIGPGGTFFGIAAWVSGTTFREGGSYKTDDPNNAGGFNLCYPESDQNPAQIVAPCQIIGGPLSVANAGNAASLKCDTSGNYQLGPIHGIHDGTTYLEYTNNVHDLIARHWVNGIPTNIASIRMSHAFSGTVYDVLDPTFLHWFNVNGSNIVQILSTGLNLQSGKVLKNNGVQVVGAQQSAPPADASDLATAITLVNNLKVIIRAHGLAA